MGWIRGDSGTSTETLTELNDLRKQVAEMEQQRASARRGPPEGAERLAQGEDVVDFRPKFKVDVTKSADISSNDASTISGRIRSPITWDDLFSAIGPDMFDEASEPVLRTRIDSWLADTFADEARNLAEGYVSKTMKRKVDHSVVGEIVLSNADFGTLIVQLRALGLIAKSERGRSVKDTATYWTLTPYGDDHLTLLRAIERDAPSQTEDEDEDEDEQEE